MNKFMEVLQNKLVPATNKFAKLSFMAILRNSVMVIIPLMIVGAVGTLMANLPFEGLAAMVEPAVPFFNALATVTSNISGFAVAMSVGYFGAQHFGLDPIFSVMSSVASFFAATLTEELTINTEIFGATGMFTAIIIGFISTYILHLCKKYRIEIRMPAGVPTMVSSSFSSIIALGISVILILGIRIGFNLDINHLIQTIFSPISNGLNSLPGLLLYAFCASLLFLCGINPGVIAGFLIPIFAMNTEANAAALAAGNQPTGFVTWGMYTILCAGGTGATIGLTVLSFFSKAKVYKTLGRISILPGLFNINEPMIFGFPIMFNPIMMVPFILTPMFNVTTTWLLMEANIIGRISVEIPWTTPPIINGYLMSAGDIRTALWTGILVLASCAIYYPFFKVAERQELANEKIENGTETETLTEKTELE